MSNSHSAGAVRPPLLPRKQPRQARARASVLAIVEAAARILMVEGLQGFTTNAVAARAGVSIGSLYQYFPNKDALMAALILREQGERVARLDRLVEAVSGLPLAQALGVLIAAALAQDRAQGQLAAILDLEERRLPVDAELEQARRGLDRAIERMLGPRMPEVRAERLTAMARTLRLIAQGVIDGWSDDPASAEAETLAALQGYLVACRTNCAEALLAPPD